MAPGMPAAAIKPKAGIRRNRPPPQKVPGLDRQTGFVRFRASTPLRDPTPVRNVTQHEKQCPNGCETGRIVMADDLNWICNNCGAEVEAGDQLVSETQFAEGPGGQIRAQGVTIGAAETHRGAGAFAVTGKAGSETTPTRLQAERNARSLVGRLCATLHLYEGEGEQAMRLFSLAYAQGFFRGRSLDDIALVCLYIAIRQKREQNSGVMRPKHGIMLIDLAEQGDIDVFALGRIYSDFIREMFFDEASGRRDGALFIAPGPEVFVPRFVEELDFPGDAKHKIQNDAYNIIASMRRDWITRGRRPAGICGAAVIIAARMNNMRRTVREVVLVAKVTEITLNKRLEEFSQTPISKESVADFRSQKLTDLDKGDLLETADLVRLRQAQAQSGRFTNLPEACDPPVMNPKPKKRRRKGGTEPEAAAEIEDADEEEEEEEGEDAEQPPAKQPRIDSEGFAIPSQPASSAPQPTSTPEPGQPRKGKGRPKGSKNWRAPPATAEEQAIEDEIQHDIDENMPEMQEAAARVMAQSVEPFQEPTPAPSAPSQSSHPAQSLRPLQALQTSTTQDPRKEGNLDNIPMSPTLGALEFEDDPDVSTCVLNEEERLLKETLWVNENADWLRQDHAKRIRKQLKDAELREQGIDPVQFERNKKAQGRRRKDGSRIPGRPGDVAYLKDRDYDRRSGPAAGRDSSITPSVAGAGTPARDREPTPRLGSASPSPSRPLNATESVTRMLSQRQLHTTRLNFNAIGNIYGHPSPSSASSSRASSILSDAGAGAGSVRARSASVISSSTTTGATGIAPPGRLNADNIATTKREIRNRIKAGLPENTDRSDVIFGGIGGKNTGLQRSKGSLSAERRQKMVRASGSPAAGASGLRRGSTIAGASQQGSPEYEESVGSVSPAPSPARTPVGAAGSGSGRAEKNVSFAMQSPRKGGGGRSGASTPSTSSAHLGIEEVVEGEELGERSLIREVAPPGAFVGDDEEEDEDDDEGDGESEEDEDEDDDEEEEEEDAQDDDPEEAFAGRLRSRSRY